ncbi:MAG: amidohydrolase [Planctomycetota bacterium]|nr:amidohydrolase [Planctomycetota bacterium]
MNQFATLEEVVNRCDEIMSHAWMVRTFVKHSEEVEDYPELDGLMGIARTIFDACRALETQVEEPPKYLHMLRKKIGRLKKATVEFERDAKQVSVHTNFMMAIRSTQICVRELEELLAIGTTIQQTESATDS